MPAVTASAPGKIILFGEHAVVYGQPSIAVPVTQVRAKAAVFPNPTGAPDEIWLDAPDIGLHAAASSLGVDHPLVMPLLAVKAALGLTHLPACKIKITSTIPVAAGLGSGAAVSAALARALAGFLGRPLPDDSISTIAFQVDQHYHGTSSGVDNTVIAYAQPVFFVRGQPFQRLTVAQPFQIVIGNTGLHSPTATVVNDLRLRWQAHPETYNPLFVHVGEITCQARALIENGHPLALGPLMNENHALLQQMDVSCPELDNLVQAALNGGALGAKLCGGGRGGNMIALVEEHNGSAVSQALRAAGATHTISTCVA